jgi:hypothetical protein
MNALTCPPFTWDGSPQGVVCPVCKRLAAGGLPIGHRCSPRDWALCRRDPLAIVTGDRPFEWAMLYAPVAPIPGYLLAGAVA